MEYGRWEQVRSTDPKIAWIDERIQARDNHPTEKKRKERATRSRKCL